jgi:hypothetical protein
LNAAAAYLRPLNARKDSMRADIEQAAAEIEQSIELLRRRL